MTAKKYCIVGTGGFGRETLACLIDVMQVEQPGIDIADIALFMVDDIFYSDNVVMGVPVIRRSDFVVENYKVVVAIGEPDVRRKFVENMPDNTEYATIIHPSVVLSKWVDLGEGSIVTAGSILTCNITIGKHAHINLHTTVGHDCDIGDYFTTAPGANISGGCTFGHAVYFGTNAAIRQGVTICDNVVIGMGGVVVKDITEAGVYIGNPLTKLVR